jgi:hypothetical protein
MKNLALVLSIAQGMNMLAQEYKIPLFIEVPGKPVFG